MEATYDELANGVDLGLKTSVPAWDVAFAALRLGESCVVVKPVLETIVLIKDIVDTLKNNQKELQVLHQRCVYATACVIERRNGGTEMDVSRLRRCVKAVFNLAQRCSKRKRHWKLLKVYSDRSEISTLRRRLQEVIDDTTLGGVAAVENQVQNLARAMVSLFRRSLSECLLTPRKRGKTTQKRPVYAPAGSQHSSGSSRVSERTKAGLRLGK